LQLEVISEATKMLHNASLLIDDIQDNSKLRRGVRPYLPADTGLPLSVALSSSTTTVDYL
jgi:geranylgeranyl diphosphate synthase type 3